ncbi:MAG: aldehyde dehydrogenase family protein [Spirochaetes bacterium]|nr:aldehyde dehydrogenase family protein [Spirochaetota bacterium]
MIRSNETFKPRKTGSWIHNPATGERLAEILEHDPENVPLMVQRSRKAQIEWEQVPYKVKQRIAYETSRWIHAHADTLSLTIAHCTGKTRTEALATEVLPAAIAFRYYSQRIPHILHPKRLPTSSFLFLNKKSIQYRVPYGVIGIISPWNYPFGIPVHEVAVALLTGNGVLLKVATQCQPVGELIETMIREAGFPSDLFHLVYLSGSKVGAAFLDGGIDKLFFTGSTETGRILMQEAGKRLIPVSLELGGNDAMIVLSDAPLERAAAGAVWAGVSNCGQSCGGVERIYIERPVYDTFLTLLRQEVRQIRQGPDGFDVDIGSLTTEEQRKKIIEQVQDALSKGARLLETSPDTGMNLRSTLGLGTTHGPIFYPVQVIEVDHDAGPLMQEETFGPILAVSVVETEEEAIQRANATPYGLTASVWSLSKERVARVASQLQAGVVTVNDHLMSHGMPETPWGGFKQSSIGRTHGDPLIEETTQVKVLVWEKLPRMKRNLFWHPIDSTVYDGLKGALSLVAGKGIRTRFQGLWRLVHLLVKKVRFF